MAEARPVFSFGDGEDGGDLSRLSIDRDAQSAVLGPLKFLVTGLIPGEDPTSVIGIPQPNSTISVGDRVFFADRARTLRAFPDGGTAWVEVPYSTDRRFRLPQRPYEPEYNEREITTTFRQEIREAPTFVTRAIEIPTAAGPESRLIWEQAPITYTINVMVLTVTVHLAATRTTAQYLDLVDAANAQMDHLHQFRDRYWRFVSCNMLRTNQGRVEMAFTWESDPGNGPIGVTAGNPLAPGATLRAPERPPFYEYTVIGSGPGIPPPPPTVVLVDLFPEADNNYRQLDGWQALPENPLG